MTRGSSLLATLVRFWADDRGLSVFSFFLVVVVFLLPPLAPSGGGRSLFGDVLFAALLLSGVLALGEGRVARLVLLPAALVALAADLGGWLVPVPRSWALAMGLLSLLLFVAVVLGRTLRSGPITLHRLQGAVAAYVLLGLAWAWAYALLEVLRPGAFSGPVDAAGGARAFVYFSFVSLTTTGYGDVLPVHPAARSLASLEAVTGTVYIAILLARLVSLAATPGRGGTPPGS